MCFLLFLIGCVSCFFLFSLSLAAGVGERRRRKAHPRSVAPSLSSESERSQERRAPYAVAAAVFFVCLSLFSLSLPPSIHEKVAPKIKKWNRKQHRLVVLEKLQQTRGQKYKKAKREKGKG